MMVLTFITFIEQNIFSYLDLIISYIAKQFIAKKILSLNMYVIALIAKFWFQSSNQLSKINMLPKINNQEWNFYILK